MSVEARVLQLRVDWRRSRRGLSLFKWRRVSVKPIYCARQARGSGCKRSAKAKGGARSARLFSTRRLRTLHRHLYQRAITTLDRRRSFAGGAAWL